MGCRAADKSYEAAWRLKLWKAEKFLRDREEVGSQSVRLHPQGPTGRVPVSHSPRRTGSTSSHEKPLLVSVTVCVCVLYVCGWTFFTFQTICVSLSSTHRHTSIRFTWDLRSHSRSGRGSPRLRIVHFFFFILFISICFHGDCRNLTKKPSLVGSEVCASVRGRKISKYAIFIYFCNNWETKKKNEMLTPMEKKKCSYPLSEIKQKQYNINKTTQSCCVSFFSEIVFFFIKQISFFLYVCFDFF